MSFFPARPHTRVLVQSRVVRWFEAPKRVSAEYSQISDIGYTSFSIPVLLRQAFPLEIRKTVK